MIEYGIGTTFRDSRGRICTVTDYLITRNGTGDVIRIRYVATHDFLGQKVTDYDVIPVRIARGLIENKIDEDAWRRESEASGV